MIGMKMGISLFSGIEHDWNEIVFIALRSDIEDGETKGSDELEG
ncbi:hypothetical protein SLEP1_g25851 [Rubroshorea leprosula]|uniref:Uncharacterized protein n=1 Tax=Rubroshorea leprosula TaxID=152421 RepID=A0AAV5JKH7_9ROSI|nr:hypothetical protein SLEP1_g25851 [Rubroshorea leprosula]